MKEFIENNLRFLKTTVTIPSGQTDSNIISLFNEQGLRNPGNPTNTFGLGKAKYTLSYVDLPDDFTGTNVEVLIGITSDRVFAANDAGGNVQLSNGSIIDPVITAGSMVLGLRADANQATETVITVILTREDS